VSGGHIWSLGHSLSRTGTTDGARHRCTTTGWTAMSARPRGWYDTLFLSFRSVVDPHYLDVWIPAHNGDADATEKLVSNNFSCYA
jgi:hypothetical protein